MPGRVSAVSRPHTWLQGLWGEAQRCRVAPVTRLEVGAGGWLSRATMQHPRDGASWHVSQVTSSELSCLFSWVSACWLINVEASNWQVIHYDQVVHRGSPSFHGGSPIIPTPPPLCSVHYRDSSVPQGSNETSPLSLLSISSMSFSPYTFG